MLTTPRWYPGYIIGTTFLTLALVWAPAGLGLMRTRRRISRARVAVGIGAVVLLAVVLGRAQETQYYKHHYRNVDHFLQDGGPKEAYEFARRQSDKRIAIAGSGEIFFGQYGYYGKNIDNYVQYIGVKGHDGTYRLPTSCAAFRTAIDAGDYDYLILSQYTVDAEESDYFEPVYAWIKNDPGVTKLIEETDIEPQSDYVFRIDGPLHPQDCKPEGEAAES